MKNLLEIDDLHVSFKTHAGTVQAVRGVHLHVEKGETLGIVGESGCGKSVTAQSILQLIPSPPGKIEKGRILLEGEDLSLRSNEEMQSVRGHEIGMIFQDPMTSLNPTMRVGKQIMEGLIKHRGMSKQEAYQEAKELVELVGIPEPARRVDQYPHEFSGGMRQRIVIAIALACQPKLLIADEPTTALDVTIQAQILELMAKLQKKLEMSIILITHDLGVVAGVCDRVVVMYAGKVVEEGSVDKIFKNPRHPYTKALLRAVPRLGIDKSKPLAAIAGRPPDLRSPPRGCAFAARCPSAMEICLQKQPELKPAACWLEHPMAKQVMGSTS